MASRQTFQPDMSQAFRFTGTGLVTSVKDLKKSLSHQLSNWSSVETMEKIFKPGATICADSRKTSRKCDEIVQRRKQENVKYVHVQNTTYPKQFLGECSNVSVRKRSIDLLGQSIKNDLEVCTNSHCSTCVDPMCTFQDSCEVRLCRNGCNLLFHKCKQTDHNDLCDDVVIPCDYKGYGCDAEIPRKDLRSHLKSCPVRKRVSVVPTHSKQNISKKKIRNDIKSKYPSIKDKHDHCDVCFSWKCRVSQYCTVITCRNTGCCAKLHCCKQDDHDIVCQYKEVACINQPHGCRYTMSRLHLPQHLQKCESMDWAFLLTYQHTNLGCKKSGILNHCDSCYSLSCTRNGDGNCPVIQCDRGCGQKFHKCKSGDHEKLCPNSVVACINQQHGCQIALSRCMMAVHLLHCSCMNFTFKRHVKKIYLPYFHGIQLDGTKRKETKSGNKGDIWYEESLENRGNDENDYEKLPSQNPGSKKNIHGTVVRETRSDNERDNGYEDSLVNRGNDENGYERLPSQNPESKKNLDDTKIKETTSSNEGDNEYQDCLVNRGNDELGSKNPESNENLDDAESQKKIKQSVNCKQAKNKRFRNKHKTCRIM